MKTITYMLILLFSLSLFSCAKCNYKQKKKSGVFYSPKKEKVNHSKAYKAYKKRNK